ncbi:MAG: DUF4350 domain-containing protein [Chitinophagales bacterium]|nr:DUF4350 domain-containing protein [Chitinophagales bacterium]
MSSNKGTAILAVLLVLVLAALLFFNRSRAFDERVTLRKTDKIPYGSYVLFESLNDLFPKSTITINNAPAVELTTDSFKPKALIIVSKYYLTTEEDLKDLLHFAEQGNDVFISAASWDADCTTLLDMTISGNSYIDLSLNYSTYDSGKVYLSHPAFTADTFEYPGKMYSTTIVYYDSACAQPLGYDAKMSCNFIRLNVGKGNLFVHTQPFCFTNYFLLYRNNIQYAEQVFSMLNQQYSEVIWDEYYLTKHNQNYSDNDSSPFRILMQIPSFRYAIYVLLLMMALYALLSAKRVQRIIPILEKPKNESLDYVNTIGKLYYEKKDNLNLARKMAIYFLEHVRQRFRLVTSDLNDDLVQRLTVRSGMDQSKINFLILFARQLKTKEEVTDTELHLFHEKLEEFYHQSK